jgi:glycosyltransferase involved in cell wall biosynthesis
MAANKPARPLRVLCWAIGDQRIASSRLRVYQLVPLLQQAGLDVTVFRQASYADAIRFLPMAKQYDVIYIQKKLLPRPYLLALLSLNPRIVYDFDDALYAIRPYASAAEQRRIRVIRRRLAALLPRCAAIVAGNDALRDFALAYNSNVVVIPTTVQLRDLPLKEHAERPVTTLGWIGTGGNIFYLQQCDPVFRSLAQTYGDRVQLKVVSNQPFSGGAGMHVVNKEWRLAEEARDILDADIGLMPLTHDEWSQGKGGFKIIQYMAYGIPVVASPLGINTDIVDDGKTGFLARNTDEWVGKLSQLIEQHDLRRRMGIAARGFIEATFSADQAARALYEVFTTVAGR